MSPQLWTGAQKGIPTRNLEALSRLPRATAERVSPHGRIRTHAGILDFLDSFDILGAMVEPSAFDNGMMSEPLARCQGILDGCRFRSWQVGELLFNRFLNAVLDRVIARPT